MWSSNAFVGINRDSETTLQSIGQYIDDYIDLVENVPNDIVRGITQFHEKNHLYHDLLDKLERSLERAIACPDGDDVGRKNALLFVQKYLIEIQTLSDEKLNVGQAIYEQLEVKSRQLDLDIRAITAGQGGSSIFSPIKSSHRNSDIGNMPGSGSRSGSTSQYAANSRNNHNNSSSNNVNAGCASTTTPASASLSTAAAAGNNSEESQDSSVSPDHQENGHDQASAASVTTTSTRGKKRGGRGNHHHQHHQHHAKDSDNDEDNDADNESPIKEPTPGGGGKRTRRGAGNAPSSLSRKSSHQHDKSDVRDRDAVDDHGHQHPQHGHHASTGKGRGGGGGTKGGHRVKGSGQGSIAHHPHPRRGGRGSGSNHPSHRDSSPPSIYDEPSALDPDEPTYCVCQQISFGEMIGCDNPRCPIEWFHFACVHLTNKPKGKWYCPQCRGDRSNIQRK